MSASEPRPAATIVLVRDVEPRGIEVLMLTRSGASVFMPGVSVFPGGRVDDEDRAQAAGTIAAAPHHFVDLDVATEWTYRIAAARELAEEAGLVLTQLAALLPIAHWVTPAGESRRYDTRFFLTTAPADQQARHDGGETTDAVWMSPSDALQRSREGLLRLSPPTWTVLSALAAHESLDEVLDWARCVVVHRVEPQPAEDEAGRFMVIPGDPLLPAPPGVDVPPHTRFVLDDVRGWRPRE